MKVAMLQYASVVGDLDANLDRLIEAIERHAGEADIVVTPELYLGGYNARDGHHRLAQPLDGPAVARLQAAADAADTMVVVGMARTGRARGTIHNSAVLVRPGHEPVAYDKVHLPTFNVFEEGLYFQPGRTPIVVDTPVGRIGLAICYDLFFPELTKRMALAGADAIIAISASPTVSAQHFKTVLPARALETTTPVVYVNLVGPQDHLVFWGGSMAIDAMGATKATLAEYEEDEAIVTIDMDEVAMARKRRPTLRDTRLRRLE